MTGHRNMLRTAVRIIRDAYLVRCRAHRCRRERDLEVAGPARSGYGEAAVVSLGKIAGRRDTRDIQRCAPLVNQRHRNR